MDNFWQKLPRPFFMLAPMADVTDCVFRSLIARYSRHGEVGGGPDVFWTEFVSADGLVHPDAREALLVDLRFSEHEHPIVAQLFSASPQAMHDAAALCASMGFDGIDINMGCPERNIVKQGAGCGLIEQPELAREIIAAAQAGAGTVPVSVKTRLGFNRIETETWVPLLLSANIAALTMHLRTRKDMSKVPARWNYMQQIVAMRDELAPETIISGNGDVVSLEHGSALVLQYGCDGIMIGRGIFGNPWFFDRAKKTVSVRERLDVLVEHTTAYERELGTHKNFAIMKKHFKAYVTGFDRAKELRMELMAANTAADVKRIVTSFLATLP